MYFLFPLWSVLSVILGFRKRRKIKTCVSSDNNRWRQPDSPEAGVYTEMNGEQGLALTYVPGRWCFLWIWTLDAVIWCCLNGIIIIPQAFLEIKEFIGKPMHCRCFLWMSLVLYELHEKLTCLRQCLIFHWISFYLRFFKNILILSTVSYFPFPLLFGL